MILCWAAFIATLGHMWPTGCGLDTPGTLEPKEECGLPQVHLASWLQNPEFLWNLLSQVQGFLHSTDVARASWVPSNMGKRRHTGLRARL